MRKKAAQRPRQPTPTELTDSCLGILRSKFYQGDDKSFFQERTHLLRWVVLWPASWLNRKGVTIHGDKYREIFNKVFLNAAAHMESKVKFRPAYLRQVIQSHFAIHGEVYYEDAKAVRNLVEATMLAVGRPVAPEPDPVKTMAQQSQLLAALSPKKRTVKRALTTQPDLFA